MKKEIQYTLLTLVFTLLLLLTGCSAVPTGGRYSENGSDKTTESDEQTTTENLPKPSTPVYTIDYEAVFDGFDSPFVRIPDKVPALSKSGLFWYRFPKAQTGENHPIEEIDGFTLLVFTSDTAEGADSVETLLFEKTGINEISVNFASGKYQVFYGSYPDFTSAAEAVIKLNENNFRNCLPVPKKINIRKKL